MVLTSVKSSHHRCSVRKGVLKNFAKFTRKHLWEILFLIKLQALRAEIYQTNLHKEKLLCSLFLALISFIENKNAQANFAYGQIRSFFNISKIEKCALIYKNRKIFSLYLDYLFVFLKKNLPKIHFFKSNFPKENLLEKSLNEAFFFK